MQSQPRLRGVMKPATGYYKYTKSKQEAYINKYDLPKGDPTGRNREYTRKDYYSFVKLSKSTFSNLYSNTKQQLEDLKRTTDPVVDKTYW